MELKQKLQTFLTTGSKVDLFQAERAVNFSLIFETKSKPFCNVADERKLLQSIMKLTEMFLKTNFTDCETENIALQFAVDLTDLRSDWSLLDVLHFFKFVRQRQDLPENKIFGNKISPIKLMELTAVYEENKAIARENWKKEQISSQVFGTIESRKQLQIGTGENHKDTRFAELAEKLNEKLKMDKEKIYQNAEKTKKFLQDVEVHWNEQTALIDKGEITEQQAVINHHQYRLNYEN